MKHVPIPSSNIKSVGYDPASATLEIEFGSGGRYRYLNVTPNIAAELIFAESPGSFFASHIRPKYTCEKIEAVEVSGQ